MNELVYCITHEAWASNNGMTRDCLLAYCPPPELPLGWELLVPEPSVEEMEQINQNVIELELELA